jgi:hypothetical protein
MAGKATLSEIEEKYSINDLADANEALDIEQDCEEHSRRMAQRK